MNVKLRPEDALAVDLLLDRATTANGNGGTNVTSFATASHAGVASDRLAATQRVLHVLDAMPKGEPSPDLLQRTLQRVESGVDAAGPLRGTGTPLIDMTRPVA